MDEGSSLGVPLARLKIVARGAGRPSGKAVR